MAVGDESIGFGGTLEINDGPADAFVEVDAVISLGIPNYVMGTVESKRLSRAVVKKLPTILNGGNLTIKQDFTHAGYARMQAIKGTEKLFKFTIPDDDGDTEITVPGIVTQNKVSDLDPEKVTEFDTTVEISDEEE